MEDAAFEMGSLVSMRYQDSVVAEEEAALIPSKQAGTGTIGGSSQCDNHNELVCKDL